MDRYEANLFEDRTNAARAHAKATDRLASAASREADAQTRQAAALERIAAVLESLLPARLADTSTEGDR